MATASAARPRVKQGVLRATAVISTLSMTAATMLIVHRAASARAFERFGDALAALTAMLLLTHVWTRRGPGVLALVPCGALVAVAVTVSPRSDTVACALYGWLAATTAVVCSEAATPVLPTPLPARAAKRVHAIAVPSGLAALGALIASLADAVNTDPEYVWLLFGAVAFAVLMELLRRALRAPSGAGPAGGGPD